MCGDATRICLHIRPRQEVRNVGNGGGRLEFVDSSLWLGLGVVCDLPAVFLHLYGGFFYIGVMVGGYEGLGDLREEAVVAITARGVARLGGVGVVGVPKASKGSEVGGRHDHDVA